ncbi:MAG: molybdate ABC transporter permease subunit [Spirochaetaceae bacterium]|jgi:molybdate transport system permease protein|nr:molybdate ABC transporter permease subunit [Spirochaetaceae bacterium]
MDASPLFVSLKTASASIAFTFFLGLGAAVFVSGLRRGALKTLLDCVLTLPLVLPPTVAGFFLLALFGVEGPLGRFLITFFSIKIPFSWPAAVIAAAVISFPLMYRAARGALEQVDGVYSAAARTLGISEWRIFTRVVMPQALPGIAGGTVIAFTRALGEFGATAMIAGNIAGKTRTLPLAIYTETAAGNYDAAFQYVLVILLVCFIAVSLINYFSGV